MPKLARAIVTGATSGIGRATVRTLVESGRTVLAIARRRNRLDALADETGAEVLTADVRDLPAMRRAVEGFAPDILVNNAGVGHGVDGLAELDAALIQEAVDTNVVAPIKMTGVAVPGMRSRGSGHIVNVGSIAGLHTLTSALYGATKSAIHIFSQNLRSELLGTGIRVTEICPGRVASEFYLAAKGDRRRLDQLYASGIRELQPEDVAASILFAIDAPEHVNISTIELLPADQAVGGIVMNRSGS